MLGDYYQLKKEFVAYVDAKFNAMEVGKKYSKKALIKEIYVKFAMKPAKIEKELSIMIDDVEFFEDLALTLPVSSSIIPEAVLFPPEDYFRFLHM